MANKRSSQRSRGPDQFRAEVSSFLADLDELAGELGPSSSAAPASAEAIPEASPDSDVAPSSAAPSLVEHTAASEQAGETKISAESATAAEEASASETAVGPAPLEPVAAAEARANTETRGRGQVTTQPSQPPEVREERDQAALWLVPPPPLAQRQGSSDQTEAPVEQPPSVSTSRAAAPAEPEPGQRELDPVSTEETEPAGGAGKELVSLASQSESGAVPVTESIDPQALTVSSVPGSDGIKVNDTAESPISPGPWRVRDLPWGDPARPVADAGRSTPRWPDTPPFGRFWAPVPGSSSAAEPRRGAAAIAPVALPSRRPWTLSAAMEPLPPLAPPPARPSVPVQGDVEGSMTATVTSPAGADVGPWSFVVLILLLVAVVGVLLLVAVLHH